MRTVLGEVMCVTFLLRPRVNRRDTDVGVLMLNICEVQLSRSVHTEQPKNDYDPMAVSQGVGHVCVCVCVCVCTPSLDTVFA